MRRLLLALVAPITAAACLVTDRPVLAVKDAESPTLIGTEPPVDVATGRITQPIPPGGAIILTFSERMDERSLRPGIWIFDDEGVAIPVRIEQAPPLPDTPDAVQQTDLPFDVRVAGEQPLAPNTDHVLVLDPVLTDTEGNMLLGLDGGVSEIRIGFATGS